MRVFATSAVALLLIASARGELAAASKAAQYLVKQHAADGCPAGGTFAAGGVIERDLTGDGKPDLVIDHSSLQCNDGGRSNACGMQACSVEIYVRVGALLKPAESFLSVGGVSLQGGNPPSLKMMSTNSKPYTVRWKGGQFVAR